MGTRGLKIVRYGGRYFVYYNHWDSYPEGLGQGIINGIPLDPQKYQQWLQRQRDIFAAITAELEKKVLTVPHGLNNVIEEDVDEDKAGEGNGSASEHEQNVEHFIAANDLEDIPSTMCTMGLDLFIEWTYTIDLDRELFSVNMETHFKTNNIPHATWITGVTADTDYEEENPDQTIRTCPEASRQLPKPEYFSTDDIQQQYAAKYSSYKSSLVNVKQKLSPSSSSNMDHGEMLAVVTFEKFILSLSLQFIQFLPGWNHNDFAFREFVFAILCFATGQYHFDRPKRLVGKISSGYLLYPDSDDIPEGKSRLLPIFPIGFHHPEQEPGSAPSSAMYWFNNVLVSLVPDNILQDETSAEAAVATVVEFGRAQGKVNFNALVLSGLNTIMVQVSIRDCENKDGQTDQSVFVRRTQTIRLFPPMMDSTTDLDTFEGAYLQRYDGFRSLIRFFDAAIEQDVSRYSKGKLPNEIVAKIIARIPNFDTYASCSKVSKVFRDTCQKRVFFDKDFDITKSILSDTAQTEPLFTLKDSSSGRSITQRLSERGQGVDVWYPIVGLDRPSVIIQVRVGIRSTNP